MSTLVQLTNVQNLLKFHVWFTNFFSPLVRYLLELKLMYCFIVVHIDRQLTLKFICRQIKKSCLFLIEILNPFFLWFHLNLKTRMQNLYQSSIGITKVKENNTSLWYKKRNWACKNQHSFIILSWGWTLFPVFRDPRLKSTLTE